MRAHAAGALAIALWIVAAGPQVPAPDRNGPVFTRDVAPIFYKNCVSCHRPGEMTPMSLLTYADARP